MNRNKKEDIQVLRAYFKDEKTWKDMTEHQQHKVQLIRATYAWLLDAWDQASIVDFLHKEHKVSKTTAYRIIRDTEILFGSLRRSNKEILRQIAIAAAKKALRIAMKEGDAKMIDRATNTLANVGGLHNEDPDMPDFEKLQPSLIVTVLPEGMEQQLQQLLQGGLLDFNKFLPNQTIDIPHEEITGESD